MKRIALTGLKPTGSPHIGNYLGMIKPALELVHDFQALYFIPDYHALTTVRDREQLSSLIYESSAAWLALVLLCQLAVLRLRRRDERLPLRGLRGVVYLALFRINPHETTLHC